MVTPHGFLRGHSLWAVAAIVALASCSQSPTAPTPAPAPAATAVSMASVTPAAPIRGDAVQVLTIAGVGFRPGLVLRVTDPAGLSITVPSSDIQNLLPTSFEVSVFLRQAGRYGIVVQQQDGETSGSFAIDVRNDPLTSPQIESVSPSQTIVDPLYQPVALIGVNFDSSLIVHIVDPDNVLTVKSSPEVTVDDGSVVQFTMVFTTVGTYTFSLWNRDGQVSNSIDVRVR